MLMTIIYKDISSWKSLDHEYQRKCISKKAMRHTELKNILFMYIRVRFSVGYSIYGGIGLPEFLINEKASVDVDLILV